MSSSALQATAPLAGVTAPAAPATAGPDYRDGPGTLRVDPRVVRKLAAQAAAEVDDVRAASVDPVSRAIQHPVPASTPPEQLAIDLHLTVSVDYPRPLPVVVERLAAHVSRRVEELIGRPVRRVGIYVGELGTSARTSPSRVS